VPALLGLFESEVSDPLDFFAGVDAIVGSAVAIASSSFFRNRYAGEFAEDDEVYVLQVLAFQRDRCWRPDR